jgi:hypothetical protein
MGWWRSQRGVIGDEPADLFEKFLHDVVEIYNRRAARPPTQGELADLIEFCTRGILSCNTGKDNYAFILGDDDAPRSKPRGSQGALARMPADCLDGVDPETRKYFNLPLKGG